MSLNVEEEEEKVETFESETIPQPPPSNQWSGNSLLKRGLEKSNLEDGEGDDCSNSKQKKKSNDNGQFRSGSIYVTSLPFDITATQLFTYFSKCGLIKKDELTLEPMIKIYKDEKGNPKGDCLITYLRNESIGLAIQMLDESYIDDTNKIRVTEAKFDKKKKDKKTKPAKKSLKIKRYNQMQELSWNEESRVHIVLKNMFTLEEANDPNFYDEIREDIGVECEKLGPVELVTVFKNNAEGVAVVKFKESIDAQKCVMKMDGRFFGGHKIIAKFYDGFTDYSVKETEEEHKKRIEEWNQWLDSNNLDN
eukprot:TRINITY_DN1206_c0_g3_i1.p1 TRINITY_DN1206_c0_g3~~TRINITY_DN1206_c0_g3_i1.p1  ORF type:complete len:307 (+),score=148.57 TRINITY_DN1206_c0_g3_i1:1186-2106(+)